MKIGIQRQNTILSAAFILAAASGVSALMGFLKTRLLIQYFGIESAQVSIFIIADRIPSLIYSVLIVGAVSTVFIPVFAGLLKKDEESAFKAASSMINATFAFFFAIGAIIFAFAPQITNVLALGKFDPSEVQTGATLMRIMLTGQFLLVGGSLLTSILQSYKYFLIPAIAPILYNLGMIIGIVFLSGSFGIYGPGIGVIIGALLHFLVQVPNLRHTGFKFSFSLDLKDKGFKQMSKLIPPRIVSVFLANLIGTVNNSLAILVSIPSVVYLKSATQLETFPVNLIGLSMASAALPTLSLESGKEDLENFKKTLLTSFHQTMFFILPLSTILLILRVPAVRIAFGVYNFSWDATLATAQALGFFSLSIFSQSANYLITRAFYALKDTMTPVLVSLVTVFINIAISISFINVFHWGVWALGLSYAITSLTDMCVLLYLLDKKVGGFDRERAIVPFAKIVYATLFMGITLYLPIKLLDQVIIDTSKTLNLLLLTGIAGMCGIGFYLLFTKILRVEEIQLLYTLLRKLKLSPASKSIVEPLAQETQA